MRLFWPPETPFRKIFPTFFQRAKTKVPIKIKQSRGNKCRVPGSARKSWEQWGRFVKQYFVFSRTLLNALPPPKLISCASFGGFMQQQSISEETRKSFSLPVHLSVLAALQTQARHHLVHTIFAPYLRHAGPIHLAREHEVLTNLGTRKEVGKGLYEVAAQVCFPFVKARVVKIVHTRGMPCDSGRV